ncbi:MAG: TIGR03013 family XrtA/PEP-CTERM system glycosyltransferase [Pseudomonadota bacterium]
MRPGTKIRGIRTPLLLIAIGEAMVLCSSVYVTAYLLYDGPAAWQADVGDLFPKSVAVTAIMILSLISMGLYQFHQRLYFKEAAIRVVVAFAAGSTVLAALFYLAPSLELGRRFTTIALLYAFFGILVLRFWFLRTVDDNIFSYRTLVYGAGERAGSIGDLRRKADRRGFKILGSVPTPRDTSRTEVNGPLFEGRELLELAEELDAEEIVVALDDRRGNLPIRDLLACKLRGIEVIDLLEFLERETGKIRVDLVSPGWLIFSSGFRVTKLRRAVERGFDLSLSLLCFAIVWPILLLVALCIKLEDGPRASVFYRQRRVGLHGDCFDVLKFRSMHENAEAPGQEVWASQDDDRVTRVGKFIRKYRLDELPQILNVLRGDMSLVGPRPERPKFVAQLSESIPYYAERHTVKPGITGWAQLKYAYGSTEQDAVEKLQYDLFYVKNQGLMLDVAILLQTVEVVLWGKGAR